MLSVTTLPALDPRRRSRSRTRGHVRVVGARRWPCPTCGAWSSAGPCSTRRTATSPGPWRGRPASSDPEARPWAERPSTGLRAPWPSGSDPVALTPEQAGLGLLRAAGARVSPRASGAELQTGPDEVAVLPLSATGLTVEADGQRFELAGRPSVFARVTDFAYVGRDTAVSLVAGRAGGEVALATARCDGEAARPLRPGRGGPGRDPGRRAGHPPGDELHEPGRPGRDAEALMCVELLTPDGNWSSYPPHKHDASAECPVDNEEIYYFRIGRAGEDACSPDGFGLHRLYTGDGDHRRDGRGPRRRRVPHPPRVPRPVRRRARLHDVLPERAGRPDARALDGVLRRPRPPLGAGLVGGHADRPPLPDDERVRTGRSEEVRCLTVRCSTSTGSCRTP